METSLTSLDVEVNKKGQLNLICAWEHFKFADEFDPNHYVSELGVQRLAQHFVCDEMPETIEADAENRAVWVHPALFYHYLGWCLPHIADKSLRLYREHCNARHEADEDLQEKLEEKLHKFNKNEIVH